MILHFIEALQDEYEYLDQINSAFLFLLFGAIVAVNEIRHLESGNSRPRLTRMVLDHVYWKFHRYSPYLRCYCSASFRIHGDRYASNALCLEDKSTCTYMFTDLLQGHSAHIAARREMVS